MDLMTLITRLVVVGSIALAGVGCTSQRSTPSQTASPAPPPRAESIPTGSGEAGTSEDGDLDHEPVTESAASAAEPPAAPGATGDSPSAGADDDGATPTASAVESGAATVGTGAAGTATADEQAAELERELGRALEDFDGLLLDEQKRLERLSSGSGDTAPTDSGSGAAGSTGEGSGDRGGTATPESPSDRRGTDGGGMVGGASETSDQDRSGSGDRVPPDVGDGSDDDIVARQLREAAMAEDDPELREKLWDEYRMYKESVAAGGSEE
jgi:hypothetical protein